MINSEREDHMTTNSMQPMNDGNGEKSYAQNSTLQRKVMIKALPTIKDTIKDMFSYHLAPFDISECFKIADLGCSSGPNTLLFVSEVIDIVHKLSSESNNKNQDILFVLNDLYKNDFNNLFSTLPLFYEQLNEKYGYEFRKKCFISGVPASFYERLFPCKSFHFVHSSYSLHWLSQFPTNLQNKGHIYITKMCHPDVLDAYKNQFHKDFSSFLTHRCHEILPMGRMVLTFLGRSIPEPSSNDGCCLWELLAQSLLDMASQGLIREEDIDSFNLPIYMPYKDEVEAIIIEEKSFELESIRVFKGNWDPDEDDNDDQEYNNIFDKTKSGENVSNYIRAAIEPMLVTHFGKLIINNVFKRFAERVADHLEIEKTNYINLTVSLKKK